MPGPILIHIGYHKTGSGWLRRLFFNDPRTGFGWLGKDPSKHPVRQLVRARPFEFDADVFRAEFDELMRPAEAKGLVPVLSFERLSGHPFSGGYDAKEIADRLSAVFPKARVFVALREQHAIIASTYKQYVRSGGTAPARSFLNPPVSRGARVPRFDLRHFEYHHLVAYYQELFGPDRLLVLTYEQFVTDPAAYVVRIAEFAGLTLGDDVIHSLPYEQRSNPAPSAAALAFRRQLNRLGVRAEVNLAPMLDSKLIPLLARRVERMPLPRALEQRSDAGLRRLVAGVVGHRYVESNRITADLTGLDLASYGWTP
jgi:Sulfotransferase family